LAIQYVTCESIMATRIYQWGRTRNIKTSEQILTEF